MNEREVAGVMAHELAHVKHRDTLIMTVTATVAGALSMLANFALFFGGGRNNQMGIIGMLAMMILAPMAAMLVQMAISRTREYEADRGGAEICGNPDWLADALEKLEAGSRRIDNAGRREQPGDRPHVHHQPTARPPAGQAVLDPSQHRKPGGPTAGNVR